MNSVDLFSPYTLGRITLANRIVMAPMTRSRAIGNVPNALMATFYTQRAEAGLLITEGTAPHPNGLGYSRIPGLFHADHVEGWRKTTDAVHAAGSRIFVQLMHAGRTGHPDNLPPGAKLVAPSAISWTGQIWVDGKGQLEVPTAHAMTVDEIEEAIEAFVHASELAIEAGFDGVELHGANGYLIEQFFNTAANQRSDDWGGSVENRIRFAVEIAKRTAARIGGDRVGIRVSPYSNGGGMRADDDQVETLYETLAAEMRTLGLAYMHIVDHSSMGMPLVPESVKTKIREAFGGTIILAGGHTRQSAEDALEAGRGDLIAFARPFIANPRLPTALREGLPLASPDFSTMYTPDAKGYTDYV